ncbi:MAG TPA: 3D domain-containing protein [Pyrinomonadaceae bacterium]|nr:3D domain-containing protein [Pyrinomonadaceae bacterium]
MIKSTIFGSALGLLLAFSVISYSKTFIQQQDPKPAKIQQPAILEVAGQVPEVVGPTTPTEGAAGTSPADLAGNSTASNAHLPATASDSGVAPQTYTATAYSLRGRTASGKPVSRGLIAADPSVLPLGTRVRVEAGSWSGEYVVADTGGAIKGRRIDIWTPTTRQALQFGRRPVKLTVLELGVKRGKPASVRPRRVNEPLPATPGAQQAARQDK